MDYQWENKPTSAEKKAFKKMDDLKAYKWLANKMKQEYSGYTGSGKVYTGDNYPVFYREA